MDVFPQWLVTGKSKHRETYSVFEKHNLEFFLLSEIRACGKTTYSSPELINKNRHAAAPPFTKSHAKHEDVFLITPTKFTRCSGSEENISYSPEQNLTLDVDT